jgi:hypothetical protein
MKLTSQVAGERTRDMQTTTRCLQLVSQESPLCKEKTTDKIEKDDTILIISKATRHLEALGSSSYNKNNAPYTYKYWQDKLQKTPTPLFLLMSQSKSRSRPLLCPSPIPSLLP